MLTSLFRKAKSSLGFAVSGVAAKYLISLVSGPLLGRLVGPVPYGVIAQALVISGAGGRAADAGFSAWVMTAKSLDASEVKSAHLASQRLVAVFALVSGLIAVFAAPERTLEHSAMRFVAAFFSLLFNGFALVPIAWLVRNSRFARAEWSTTIAMGLATFGIVIPLAFIHFGALAVALNSSLYAGLGYFIVLRASGLQAVKASPLNIPTHYKFGAFLTNFSDYISSSIDILTVGMFLGIAGLGIYTRALFLTSLPGVLLVPLLQKSAQVKLRKVTTRMEELRAVIQPMLVIFIAFCCYLLVPIFHIDLPGFILGKKFSISEYAFMTCVYGQVLYFVTMMFSSWMLYKRALGVMSTCYIIHLVGMFLAIQYFKPHDQDAAMLLYLQNCVARAVILLIGAGVTLFITLKKRPDAPHDEESKLEQAEALEPGTKDFVD